MRLAGFCRIIAMAFVTRTPDVKDILRRAETPRTARRGAGVRLVGIRARISLLPIRRIDSREAKTMNGRR